MYNMSPAKVSEIKAKKREIFHNLTESVIFIADGNDWCSDLAIIDLGRPQFFAHIIDVTINF